MLSKMIPELSDLLDTGIVTKTTALAIMKNLSNKDQEELISSMDTTKKLTQREIQHALNLEISENETRKDFSKAERIDYARRLERVESLKAKEQIVSNQNNESAKEKFPRQESLGQVRDIVADKLNIGSGKQYEKEKFIVDNKSSLTTQDFAD